MLGKNYKITYACAGDGSLLVSPSSRKLTFWDFKGKILHTGSLFCTQKFQLVLMRTYSYFCLALQIWKGLSCLKCHCFKVFQIWNLALVHLDKFRVQPVVCAIGVPATIHVYVYTHTT